MIHCVGKHTPCCLVSWLNDFERESPPETWLVFAYSEGSHMSHASLCCGISCDSHSCGDPVITKVSPFYTKIGCATENGCCPVPVCAAPACPTRKSWTIGEVFPLKLKNRWAVTKQRIRMAINHLTINCDYSWPNNHLTVTWGRELKMYLTRSSMTELITAWALTFALTAFYHCSAFLPTELGLHGDML